MPVNNTGPSHTPAQTTPPPLPAATATADDDGISRPPKGASVPASARTAAKLNVFGRLESWLLDGKRAQYGTSILRILLGACAVAIVATNIMDRKYIWGTASGWAQPYREDSIWNFWLFKFFGASDPDWMLIAKLVLFAVFGVLMVLGWRTRIVTVVTWLMFTSLAALGPTSSDSADNAFRIMLLYSFLTDGSLKWSLDSRRRRIKAEKLSTGRRVSAAAGTLIPPWIGVIVHNLAVVAIGAQVIVIYLIAGLAKARGALWQNGTAIYYPMYSENFSPWPQLNHLLVANNLMVHLISWGSVAIQMLFPLLLLNRWTRRLAVVGMIAMHAGIGIFLGLSVFSLAMVAADVIYVRDSTMESISNWVRCKWGTNARRQKKPYVQGPDDAANPDPA
ncbi:HTTM domain-containing protein [Paenarthrobacter sp. Z7-10]|uniref:HTTM domain-containing protein n=1 Tax=Paenarthrobacter sp. Z7-10 TaxID=2787635 RepID=UPI0022A9CA4A|nr:HTTM domain-containing protein [Paenarthrobacter sp. Z7-10]MCZ2401712.1 HTTM domain-containing protein [Paenarthrobacter sp. Z7-10]